MSSVRQLAHRLQAAEEVRVLDHDAGHAVVQGGNGGVDRREAGPTLGQVGRDLHDLDRGT